MFRLNAYTLNGGDVVSAWYAKQTGKAGAKRKAKLDAIMLHLRQQPRELWIRGYYDTLRDGIGEVRFKLNGINYRPLGYFGPGRYDFTFLFFATKTNEFDPLRAIDIAVSRRGEIQNGSVRVKEIKRWDHEG